MSFVHSGIATALNWNDLTKDDAGLQKLMSGELRDYIREARWYGGKASRDKALFADHLLPIDWEGERFYLLLIEILYEQGFVQHYLLPLAKVATNKLEQGATAITSFEDGDVLVDAVHVETFRSALFQLMKQGGTLELPGSRLVMARGRALKSYEAGQTVNSKLLNVEQSNTTIVYEDEFFFKLYRRLFRDPNPDIEVVQFISERTDFAHVPAFASSITWSRDGLYDISFGMMQAKVENQGDAWTWMLGHLQRVFATIRSQNVQLDSIPAVDELTQVKVEQVPESVAALVGTDLLESIALMGRRTAGMHISISSDPMNRHFSKSSYNSDYSVWLKNRIMYQFEARYALLDENFRKLSELAQHYARFFQENKAEIKNRIFAFDERLLSCQRIRIHGDYHLGQVLVAGNDFCILDFEGEPESTVHDRKVKQTALKDVAGMFRSFHYAIYATIFELGLEQVDRKEQFEIGERLYHWMANVFLEAYLEEIYASHLNLGYRSEIRYLLRYHILEKAIYELGYELNARPTWAIIPLRGIYSILNSDH